MASLIRLSARLKAVHKGLHDGWAVSGGGRPGRLVIVHRFLRFVHRNTYADAADPKVSARDDQCGHLNPHEG